MIRRKFKLDPTHDAAIAVILTSAIVKEMGDAAYAPRMNRITRKPKRFTAIEIAQRAHNRAYARFELQMRNENKKRRISG